MIMKRITTHAPRTAVLIRLLALAAALCLLIPALSAAESAEEDEWVNFLLLCNEGMNNDKGNAGNTVMVVAMNPKDGRIRLLGFTWDTFIEYEGYDVPQRLDMPFRNGGVEEVVKVFDANFGMDIHLFMSLNYLNLASMIDEYGGVNVDITRAERNALNGMVASKKIRLQDEVKGGLLTQAVIDMLAADYYLNEFGSDTHLNGLQAVGFGWLQYDSVYNCCLRETAVIGCMFNSVATTLDGKVAFCTDEYGRPDEEDVRGKRIINLDSVTEDDMKFLRRILSPIFDKAYHNLSEDNIDSIILTLARTAYLAKRQGVNLFERVEVLVLPIEARDGKQYDIIAGAKGYIIDKEANMAAINEFLYAD